MAIRSRYLGVIFNYEIVNNKVLSFNSVLTHVKLKELSHRILFAERHAVESHVGTDESAEFLGRDFTKALESCYLGICPKLVDGCNTLFISITIIRVIG